MNDPRYYADPVQAVQAKVDVQGILNAVYLGAVKECEEREAAGTLKGNGHHMAQQIQARVKALLEERYPEWFYPEWFR